MTKTSKIIKELSLTMEALNKELCRNEPCDIRLEYLFNKIGILESHI